MAIRETIANQEQIANAVQESGSTHRDNLLGRNGQVGRLAVWAGLAGWFTTINDWPERNASRLTNHNRRSTVWKARGIHVNRTAVESSQAPIELKFMECTDDVACARLHEVAN